MSSRSLAAGLALTACCAALLAALRPQADAPDGKPARAVKQPPTLPGVRADGFVQLPNGWALKPAGRQVELGDFPVNIAPHPSQPYLAVLHAGFREHEVVILDVTTPARARVVSRSVVDQTYIGLAWSPDGRRLFCSGGEYESVHAFDFERGYLNNRKTFLLGGEGRKLVVGGLAADPAGKAVYAAGTWGDVVLRVPADDPGAREVLSLAAVPPAPGGEPPSPPDGRKQPGAEDAPKNVLFPYTCLVEPSGKRLFVSLWGRAAVAVLDTESGKLLATWETESHPTEMTLTPDGKALYVACANSTKASVLDAATGKSLQTVNCALYPQAPSGNTPNSLCLSADGQLLFVANADANNVAVFNAADPAKAVPLGYVPTGWYPTSVRFDGKTKTIYVANGKGTMPKPNRHGTQPGATPPGTVVEYIGALFRGTLGVIPMPNERQMAAYTKDAHRASPLKADASAVGDVPADNPVPKKVGDPSPIKHVIYVIKENRTYDQVFGDVPEGNGDPSLCLFGEQVTPNHHKLAREFVLLDNTYVDGEVSADGHMWSMAAYATDFTEKSWPLGYRSSVFGGKGTIGYPSEGLYPGIERPAGGFLWDRAAAAGVSYRSYGEWVDNAKKVGDPGRATVKALEGHIDPLFRSYDLDYPDVKRAERFLSELKRFEKEGGFPQLSIVRLPNDHTAGTRVGKPTPRAMVAENDLALGLLVEGVSKSKFWKETAIFVIEDDAQNGPDHVDAHRVVALVVSPYTKRKFVDSTMYSTSSLLRTMELILGLQPMSQFDAAARPMYNSFRPTPDATPYEHAPARIDVNELNKPGAWGAERSAAMNLDKEDAADDLQFNEVVWKSVKGPHSPMPAPVRAAFFIPIKRDKDGDD